jgi:lactoylglutathione lyase
MPGSVTPVSDPELSDQGAVVNHIGLCVTDLERSRRFYEEVLGFEPERTLTLPDEAVTDFLAIEAPVNVTAVYLRRGPFLLELLHYDRPGNPPATGRVFNEPGLTHISVSVDDLDGALAGVVDHGGEIVTSLPGMAAIVRDPDGQLVELLPMAYRSTLG